MRVLICHPGPSFSVADVWAGWAKALRQAGCDVGEFNLNDRLEFYEKSHVSNDDGPFEKCFDTEEAVRLACRGLESACYRFWPDVVIVVSGFYFDPATYDVMRDRGHKVVLLHTESPYEDDRQWARAHHVDLNLLNDPTNIERFRQVAPTEYFGHAYDPDVHHPTEEPAEFDVSFVGTGYPSRIKMLEQVDWSGLSVALAGNWPLDDDHVLRPFLVHKPDECIANGTAADLYRRSRLSLNIYRQEATARAHADGWAMGPREVELAACGTFYLTEARGENRAVLPMVPTFDGPDDLGRKIRWWLDRPEERARVTAEAQAAVADRTFHNHGRRLLRLLA